MKRDQGFSLIEIVLVIVILSITIAAVVPNFSKNYDRLKMKQIADDLKTKSRWAQGMAMGTRQEYRLVFKEDLRSYRLMRGTEAVAGNVGRPSLIFDGIRLKVSDEEIIFYPDGTIDKAEITVSSGEKKIVLSTSVMRGLLMAVDDE